MRNSNFLSLKLYQIYNELFQTNLKLKKVVTFTTEWGRTVPIISLEG